MITFDNVLEKVNNRVSELDMMEYLTDDLENLVSAIMLDLGINNFIVSVDEISDGKYTVNIELLEKESKFKSADIYAWDKKENFAEILFNLIS